MSQTQLARDQEQNENLGCHKVAVFATKHDLDFCSIADRFEVTIVPFSIFLHFWCKSANIILWGRKKTVIGP